MIAFAGPERGDDVDEREVPSDRPSHSRAETARETYHVVDYPSGEDNPACVHCPQFYENHYVPVCRLGGHTVHPDGTCDEFGTTVNA